MDRQEIAERTRHHNHNDVITTHIYILETVEQKMEDGSQEPGAGRDGAKSRGRVPGGTEPGARSRGPGEGEGEGGEGVGEGEGEGGERMYRLLSFM